MEVFITVVILCRQSPHIFYKTERFIVCLVGIFLTSDIHYEGVVICFEMRGSDCGKLVDNGLSFGLRRRIVALKMVMILRNVDNHYLQDYTGSRSIITHRRGMFYYASD